MFEFQHSLSIHLILLLLHHLHPQLWLVSSSPETMIYLFQTPTLFLLLGWRGSLSPGSMGEKGYEGSRCFLNRLLLNTTSCKLTSPPAYTSTPNS